MNESSEIVIHNELFDFAFDVGKNFDHYFPRNNMKTVLEEISIRNLESPQKLKKKVSPRKFRSGFGNGPRLSRMGLKIEMQQMKEGTKISKKSKFL